MSEDRLARIETALAELPTKADLADLQNAIAPSPSVSGVGEMVRVQDRGSDLHFRTGRRGKLARFFVARRAAGDPLDATIVLPCLIFLTLVWLADTGRINVGQSVIPWGLFIPAGLAGCWMGVCLGYRGINRAILRGILVGAFEGAALPGLIKAAASQSTWLKLAVVLMWANSLWFWTGAMCGSVPSDIFTQTEEEWQKTAPRRAFIRKIIRLTLRLEDLKGESTPVGILVHAVRWLGLPLLLTWGAWAFAGENPLTLLTLLKDYLVHSK